MSPEPVTEILKSARTIAVVGLSADEMKPSFGVSEYMQRQGYRIIPVNPSVPEVLGEKSYPSLSAIPDKIDIVDVFRRPDAVPAIVDEVIALKVPVLWLQEGVVHEQAAEKARQAGVKVVMDSCILKEHKKRRAELA
jgi:predicted CoA-binding protein